MPLISIIIPTLNCEENIESCFNSIIGQAFKNFEVVIQDGQSTDATLRIIRNIANAHPEIRISVFSEKDSSVYDAMNKGINNSSGQWLYFIGTDDTLYNNQTLQNISSAIVSMSKVPDMLYGNVLMKYTKEEYGEKFDLDRLLFEGNICHQAIFYKKELFTRLGLYNEKYKILADWDFNIRCFKNPSLTIQYINETIAVYNDKDGLSSKKYDYEFLREIPLPYLQNAQKEVEKIKKSRRYKIGNTVLSPFSFLKKLVIKQL